MKEKHKMRRYNQFHDIIRDIKPRMIIEIGTHRGMRAKFLSGLALRWSERVHYTGFDIFDAGDQEFNDDALNQKGLPTVKVASDVLKRIGEQVKRDRYSWELVKGDTRETLAGRSLQADLVFIDGDHRLETIRSDYAAVKNSKCVVFDDYLSVGDNGELPDLSAYGANRLVDELPGAEVMPIVDRAKGGWNVAFAIIKR